MTTGARSRTGLSGRRALVVGASRGIGAAVAHRLAADGAGVALVARSEGDLRSVARTMPGAGHTVHPHDLTDPAATAALCDELAGDGADVVVCGLRTRRAWAPLRRMDAASFGGELAADTAYVVDLAAALLPAQRRAGFGRWVAISSAVATLGGAGQATYVAQKAALEGLVRSLAVEEGRHGITANVVAPGFVTTEGTDGAYDPAVSAALGAANALRRPGRPEEVAHVVAMLAAPGGGFLTGATIPVSGGAELGWALADAAAAARPPSVSPSRPQEDEEWEEERARAGHDAR